MKNVKQMGAWMLALLLVFGMLAAPFKVQAAVAKPALSKSKMTMTAGKSVQLKLKNAPKGKTVIWSSSQKSVASVSQKGKVTAKKAGKAKITATVSKKSYSCTVTVRNSVLTNTKGKNAADVRVLEKIVADQLKKGASVSTDLDHYQYYWNSEGRLVQLDWSRSDLTGSLNVKGLSALEEISCFENKLSSLDVSGCPALIYLNCSNNRLTSLSLTKNPALLSLYCFSNQLSSLDVSGNKKLSGISCGDNQLSSLDLSQNTLLSYLDCEQNRIKSLDLSNNTLLVEVQCDDTVVVTGYQPAQTDESE